MSRKFGTFFGRAGQLLPGKHFFDHRQQRNITVTPHKRFFGDIASYREPGLRGSWGGEGNRPWGVNRGNSGSGSGRMARGRGEQGLSGSDFKSRGGGKNQNHPLFNRRSGLSREKFSVPERTTGNPGGRFEPGENLTVGRMGRSEPKGPSGAKGGRSVPREEGAAVSRARSPSRIVEVSLPFRKPGQIFRRPRFPKLGVFGRRKFF